jgi:hypothetical protein
VNKTIAVGNKEFVGRVVMAFTNRANIARLTFKAAGRELLVSGFSARERVSGPFEIEVSLAAEEEIGFDDMVGKAALLTVAGDEVERYFNGIVRTFLLTGGPGDSFSTRRASCRPCGCSRSKATAAFFRTRPPRRSCARC